MTRFRFDDKLRDSIAYHLGRFDVQRRADPGGLKRAAVAVAEVADVVSLAQ